MKAMGKAELQAYLDKEKERFTGLYGGEVIRYASPENPNKIVTGVKRKIHNLKAENYQEFLTLVAEGRYAPDTNFQQRAPSRKEIRLDDCEFM